MDANEGFRWRGHTYERIEPLFPEADGFGEDVTDAQRCWVGYVPSSEQFLLGFDLWLEGKMAGGLMTIQLIEDGASLATRIDARERFAGSFYDGKTLDEIRERFPDLVEVDID